MNFFLYVLLYLDDPLFLQQSGLQRLSTPPPRMRHLHTYHGNEMATFVSHGYFPKGILRIVLIAKDAHSKVQLYATSTPRQESDFPLLPDTAGVDIISNEKSSVTVAWKQSPSHTVYGYRINYCVSFNPRRNYRTLCALKADLDAEIPPPWPKNAGFGFSWEDEVKQRINNLRKNFHKTTKYFKDTHFECVGARHWASVSSLLPGRQYYVNVFAMNEFTNRSVVYLGATFKTHGKEFLPLLHPGMVQTIQIGESNEPYVSYALELKNYMKKLAVFMQTSCPNVVKADVINNDGMALISNIPIKKFHKITLRHLKTGNYTVRLHSTDEGSHQVKLCYTGKMRKCPYHSVPHHLYLNATKNEASCRSVTFRWPSASLQTKYCLYKKKNFQHEDNLDVTTSTNGCNFTQPFEQQRGFEMVFCRQYKKNSPQRSGNIITDTVWDLKTQTNYWFHLQGVMKMDTVIDYESVNISMGDKCK